MVLVYYEHWCHCWVNSPTKNNQPAAVVLQSETDIHEGWGMTDTNCAWEKWNIVCHCTPTRWTNEAVMSNKGWTMLHLIQWHKPSMSLLVLWLTQDPDFEEQWCFSTYIQVEVDKIFTWQQNESNKYCNCFSPPTLQNHLLTCLLHHLSGSCIKIN